MAKSEIKRRSKVLIRIQLVDTEPSTENANIFGMHVLRVTNYFVQFAKKKKANDEYDNAEDIVVQKLIPELLKG